MVDFSVPRSGGDARRHGDDGPPARVSAEPRRAVGEASTKREARSRAPWILLALFLLSLPAVTPRLYASDEIQYFAYLRSLWFDADVSFDNEYRHFYDAGIARSAGFHETFLERTTETGRRLNFGTIGTALVWSPFYAVADVTARVAAAAGWPVAADGYSTPYMLAIAIGSVTCGWLALLLSMRIAERVAGRALSATLAVLAGTPLLFYMYLAPGMSHAASAFAVALFIWVWLRVRETWTASGLAALGASAALMTMVREQDAFIAIGPALDLVLTTAGRVRGDRVALRSTAGAVAAGAAAFAVTFLPQAFAYLALNGRLGPSRLVERKMTWSSPYALDVLVSPDHGFFFWTPLALLSIAGLVWLAFADGGGATSRESHATRRRIAVCALVAVASQVYISGAVESWTVAGAFGQRRFVGITCLLVLGLAALVALVGRRPARLATAAVVALCIWWNLGLIAQFGAGLMDRQRLDLAANARTTFLVLPRLAPELAWRYLFDRGSFYERTAAADEGPS